MTSSQPGLALETNQGLGLFIFSPGAVDRIVSLSRGSRDYPSNMQGLPKTQHQDKTRRNVSP